MLFLVLFMYAFLSQNTEEVQLLVEQLVGRSLITSLKTNFFYKYLSRYLTLDIQLPVSGNIYL